MDPFLLSAFLSDLERENALPRTILYNLNPADTAMLATMAVNFAADGAKEYPCDMGLLGKLVEDICWKNAVAYFVFDSQNNNPARPVMTGAAGFFFLPGLDLQQTTLCIIQFSNHQRRILLCFLHCCLPMLFSGYCGFHR